MLWAHTIILQHREETPSHPVGRKSVPVDLHILSKSVELASLSHNMFTGPFFTYRGIVAGFVGLDNVDDARRLPVWVHPKIVEKKISVRE